MCPVRELYTRGWGAMLTFLNCPPNPTFNEAFDRCCEEYEELFFASAYCNWPQGSLLNSPLRSLVSITAVLGIPLDANQHARVGFREVANAMKEEGRRVHVHGFQPPPLFHPKIYIFRRSSDSSRALIVGSSNFTRAAFSSNEELDILLEGKLEGAQFETLRQRFSGWFSSSTCLTGQCVSR